MLLPATRAGMLEARSAARAPRHGQEASAGNPPRRIFQCVEWRGQRAEPAYAAPRRILPGPTYLPESVQASKLDRLPESPGQKGFAWRGVGCGRRIEAACAACRRSTGDPLR